MKKSIAIAVLTVSDTRKKDTDKSGGTIIRMAEDAGHHITDYLICPDDQEQIRQTVDRWLGNDAVEAIIITGGARHRCAGRHN